MKVRRIVVVLSASPWGCVGLAGLAVLLGVAFVAGWVPSSDIPRYWPGHDWFMAVLCLLLAGLFAYCSVVGFRSRGRSSSSSVK